MKTITKSQLRRLVQENIFDIFLTEKNPKVIKWGDKFAIKFVNPRKGEYLWTGDGWIHQMDLRRGEVHLFPKEEIEENLNSAIDYIVKWKPGWEDYFA